MIPGIWEWYVMQKLLQVISLRVLCDCPIFGCCCLAGNQAMVPCLEHPYA